MTKGFSPLDGKWKESIEKSAGSKRKTNLQADAVRRVQEMNKPRKKKED